MTKSFSPHELESHISTQQELIREVLASYDLESAIVHWLDTMRGAEELINLTTVDWGDDAFEKQLYEFPVYHLLAHYPEFIGIRTRLENRFGEYFANRFSNLIFQGNAMATAFWGYGLYEAASGFQTIGSMIGYLQSRRRHFVGLLHFMSIACQGSEPVEKLDTFNIFLPIVELYALSMMNAQYALVVKLAQKRLGMIENAHAELNILNELFLEPERLPITEIKITDKGKQMLKARELLASNQLFSAAELRNDILLIEARYLEFDLHKSDFVAAASLLRILSSKYIDRDYWIQISRKDLLSLFKQVDASQTLINALKCDGKTYTYMQCLSSYAPLISFGDRYLSTVTLLSRFIYFWRARVLERNKRFQIRSGFIFESQVKCDLEEQGFIVQDIVRINRQEFDVVTVRDGIIWNVQCKNNFINLDKVDSDAVAFSRYNSRLVHSYEKALEKERSREHLLKSKLALNSIEHMVVSRFPVVTDNPRIVVFSRISNFAKYADEILSEGGQVSPKNSV